MTKTANRRRKVEMPSGIRKKFTAALSMLLIAAIMMVGSTYAWFTLSTAPEVKGISTSIGANGNLEIALLNATSYASTAADLGIVSNVGDSMENTDNWTVEDANETWGNLVDLSAVSYGLANVTLMPAALYVTDLTNKIVDADSILKVALSGNDGRVISVNEDTVIGQNDNGTFKDLGTAMAGVRGIGVSTGTTQRQLEFRAAVTEANTALSSAKTKLDTSLRTRGPELGQLLVKLANADNGDTFTASDVAVIENIVTDIAAANADVLTGIRQATLAYILSAANTTALTDDQVAAAKTAFATVSVDDVASTAATYGITTLPGEISDLITQYNLTESHITNAQTKIGDMSPAGGPYVYSTTNDTSGLKAAIDSVITRSAITVNGKPTTGLTSEQKTELANEILNSKRATITMGDNSGLYYDIAKSTGNTNVTVVMDVDNSGVTIEDVSMTFNVNPTAPYLLPDAINIANTAGAYTGTGGGTAFAVTPYGYALDFGFRTNASNVSLMLQDAAAQRVYSDSQNTQTQGAGSYLEFTATTGFNATKVEALMGAIRIVFTTPTADGYEILAVAKAGSATVDGDKVKAPLALYEYTLTEQTGEAPVLTVGDVKKDADDNADYTITALTKNQAKKITVIVYLDGDAVDNTMVANAATSMAGKLNLQFASSADLVPMENAALRGNAAVTHHTKAEVAALYAQLTGMSGYAQYLEAALAANPASPQQQAAVDLKTAADNVADDTTTDPDAIDQVYNNIDTAITAWNAYLATQG